MIERSTLSQTSWPSSLESANVWIRCLNSEAGLFIFTRNVAGVVSSMPKRGLGLRMQKVYVDTNQYCEEASLDTQRLINLVARSGFSLTRNVREADVIIFYACGHLRRHEIDSTRILEKIAALKKPSARLIVWGCLPKINPEVLKNIYAGPLLGPESWDFFCDLFGQPKERIHEITANTLNIHNELEGTQLPRMRRMMNFFRERFYSLNSEIWYIKIESGCRNCCTYCSDRLSYKWLRSQACESIIRQFDLGLRKGYRYFYFVGRDLGSYGYDLGLTLNDLLEKIAEAYPYQKYKLILTNISPNMLIDLYPTMNHMLLSEKTFEIGSHIQSGSERILKLMGKTFPIDKWQGIIRQIDKDYPEIRTRTSIMVGFPGETESDYRKTLHLVNNVLFDRIDVYKYEERPGIPALRLKEVVPENIKQKRYDKMRLSAFMNNLRKRIRHARIAY